MQERNYLRISLLVISLVFLYFAFRIFQTFLLSISLALILVTLCYPVFSWTSIKFKGNRSWAALLTCIWVTAAIILPVALLLILLMGQIGAVYQQGQEYLEDGGFQDIVDLQDSPYLKPAMDWISPYVDWESLDIVGSVTAG